MIVRFNIDMAGQDQYDYRVTYEGEDLYADAGLGSIEACVTAALEGLGNDAVAADSAACDANDRGYRRSTSKRRLGGLSGQLTAALALLQAALMMRSTGFGFTSRKRIGRGLLLVYDVEICDSPAQAGCM
jgi:hypothetical protein